MSSDSHARWDERLLDDGHGSSWHKCNRPDCGLEIVRPGKVQCWCDNAVRNDAYSAETMELVDDLADVLTRMVVGWEHDFGFDLAKHPEVVRVMARYRAARAPEGQNY